jgi:hypothetical protein
MSTVEHEFSAEFLKERASMRTLAVRGADVSRNLDVFLACAVAGVLGNRFFLVLTGYPQLGNGTLHISHAIWGGLMMVTAIVVALSFIAPGTRAFVAVVGGAGFGWFVDELGKFITRDVNYFFRPTLALIYVVFISMYLVFRSLARRRFRADEALLNALEALKSAAIGRLDEPTRLEALALLDHTCTDEGLVPKVRDLLHHVATIPAPVPVRATRLAEGFRRAYERWADRRSFAYTVGAFFSLLAVFDVGQVLALKLTRSGIHTFPQWATVVSSLVSLVLVVIGAGLLPRARLAAFRWLEASVLVAIFVTQVFLFADQQLAGILDLGVALVVWLSLRQAIRLEAARHPSVPSRSRSSTPVTG